MTRQIFNLLAALAGLNFFLFLVSPTTAQQATEWSSSCIEARVCELKTEIRVDETVAARLSVINLRGQFILQYTLPLGIDITQGIQIAIDDEPRIPTRLVNCTAFGCTGTINLDSEIIQSMKRGSELNVLYTESYTQDTFAITFSLSGFTVGFAEIAQG